jgi:hypothetical protein
MVRVRTAVIVLMVVAMRVRMLVTATGGGCVVVCHAFP